MVFLLQQQLYLLPNRIDPIPSSTIGKRKKDLLKVKKLNVLKQKRGIKKNNSIDCDYYSIEWRNYKYGEFGIIENIKIGSPMNKRINNWMSWNSSSRINIEYI